MLPASTSAVCRAAVTSLLSTQRQVFAASSSSSRWGQQRHSSSSANQPPAEPVLQYQAGLPVVTLQLPSRREQCQFTLKPVSNTIGDLVDFVKQEDKGVDFVAVYNEDGTRMANATPIEHLLRRTLFRLRVNDELIEVQPATAPGAPVEHVELSTDTMRGAAELKSMVASLHAALNVDDHQLRMEQQLLAEIEDVKTQLRPLEEARQQIATDCDKRTQRILWAGLGAMGLQWGAFARLTWWEYSWDIMEPVTYFATYSTVIAGFMYFMVTQQSYEYPDARDRLFLRAFHKRARKLNFDIAVYNALRERLHMLEADLRRVRDPLYLHLPLTRLHKLGHILPK